MFLFVKGRKYLLIRQLQSGGLSSVFEVEDIESGIRYALKVTNMEFKSHVQNEVRTLKQLAQSNRVVDLVAFDCTAKTFYTLLELCDHDFFEFTNGSRVRNPTLRKKYFRQMCLCLLQVHLEGLAHRDIKRENFLTFIPDPCPFCRQEVEECSKESQFFLHTFWNDTKQFFTDMDFSGNHKRGACPHKQKKIDALDDEVQLKLTDFGCSLRLFEAMKDPNSSESNDFIQIHCNDDIGTSFYLPPEAASRNEDGLYTWSQRSDVWALGIILFEMVWGRRPFASRSEMIALTKSTPKFAMPPAFESRWHEFDPDRDARDQVIRWCLEFNPRERPSVSQLLQHPYLFPLPSCSQSVHYKSVSEADKENMPHGIVNELKHKFGPVLSRSTAPALQVQLETVKTSKHPVVSSPYSVRKKMGILTVR